MFGLSAELITKINWPPNLFTVANLSLVINSADKPNIYSNVTITSCNFRMANRIHESRSSSS